MELAELEIQSISGTLTLNFAQAQTISVSKNLLNPTMHQKPMHAIYGWCVLGGGSWTIEVSYMDSRVAYYHTCTIYESTYSQPLPPSLYKVGKPITARSPMPHPTIDPFTVQFTFENRKFNVADGSRIGWALK